MKLFGILLWLSAFAAWSDDFSLTNRVRFTNQHVDVRIVWDTVASTNGLSLRIHDGDHATNYLATNAVLVALESSKLTLPDGFEVFGAAGSPFWVLPQSQDPALLYAGFSAEGLPRNLFDGSFNIRLRSVNGPGNMFIWQAAEFGSLEIFVNTRDGIDDSDRVPINIGGHGHYNFGFTTNGLYEVVFQPVGRFLGADTNLFGDEVAILFAVEPIPTNTPPELTLWQQWQRDNWPSSTEVSVIGADADPDGDGASNAQEFLTGTDPRSPASRSGLSVALQNQPTPAIVLELQGVVIERLESVVVALESAPSPGGPWTGTSEFAQNGTVLRWQESLSAGPGARFYKLRISLR